MAGSRQPPIATLGALQHHLERAMASYYHAAELTRNPLAQLLQEGAGNVPPEAADLRALLREALESIRPQLDIAGDDSAWLPYRVATMHYLQSQSRGVVCEELAISQATFYRHRREALDAMADHLWRRRATPAPRGPSVDAHDAALGRAVSAVAGRYREPLDLDELARGVQSIVERLPGASLARLFIDVMADSAPVFGDPSTLRQAILNLVTDALAADTAQPIHLELAAEAGAIRGTIEPLGASAGSGVQVARQLLESAGGQLTLEAGLSRATFTLPPSLPPLVVCLDDDADAARLYEIYLAGSGLRLCGVTTGDALRAVLAEELPSVIVLDVLMPREDGWAILEELQRDEHLRHIPVVICSVLQQPELALAMGAAAVLTKPVTPESLRQTLETVLAGHGSPVPSS